MYYEFTWELALILQEKKPFMYNFNLLDVTIGKHSNDETRNLVFFLFLFYYYCYCCCIFLINNSKKKQKVTRLFEKYKTPTYDALSMWKRSTADGDILAQATCTFCSDFKLTKNSKSVFEVAGGPFSVGLFLDSFLCLFESILSFLLPSHSPFLHLLHRIGLEYVSPFGGGLGGGGGGESPSLLPKGGI